MQIVDARIKVYVRFNRNIMGCKLITDTKVENGDTDLIGT